MNWRARGAMTLAVVLLTVSLVATAHAIALLFGRAEQIPFSYLFGGWTLAIVLAVIIAPPSMLGAAGGGSGGFRLARASFRAALTGPLAELGRPRKRPLAYLLRQPAGVITLLLGGLMVVSFSFAPVGFWMFGLMQLRVAAWFGSPLAAAIERNLGVAPKLRRNRRHPELG